MLTDLRHALRSLMKSPGFTAVTVLTLGLGMGASTAIYTLLKRVVLDPLPYPASDRLVRVKNPVPGVSLDEEWNLSTAQYFYLREHARLDGIGLYRLGGSNVLVSGEPYRATAATVTASTLALLGARPVLGRVIDESDDVPGAPRVVMLSHGFWQQQFGGDASIVGRTLTLDENPYEVIGVLAQGADLPQERGSAIRPRVDLWIPMQLDPAGPFFNSHVNPGIARLTGGVAIEGAQAEIDRLVAALPEAYPRVYFSGFFERYGFRTRLYPLKQYVLGDMSRNLWILFGAVGLVLLIACANVANLFLVRSEGRSREVAIRTALGAGRRAIARYSLIESVVLALAGSGLAALLAYWSVEWLTSLAPAGLPRLEALRLDVGVLWFTFVLAVVLAGGLAAVSLVQYRPGIGIGSLGEGGNRVSAGPQRRRLRGSLVVSQVALALVLVVAAGLLVQSFRRLRAVDPGIDARGVFTAQLVLSRAERYDTREKVERFYDDVLEQIEALPGVLSAAVSASLPFTDTYACTLQFPEDATARQRLDEMGNTYCAGFAPTTAGYFESLGIPIVAGRDFTQTEQGTGVVIVSKALADLFWPGEDVIGKGVRLGNPNADALRVVGVAGDVYAEALGEPAALVGYYPIASIGAFATMHLVVRTELADPLSLLPAVRSAVAEVDPLIPLANAETIQARVDRSMSRLAFTVVLLGLAGGVALLLAAVGLYGVISYLVACRTGEIGVRMALGAAPASVARFVVGSALKLTMIGVAIGLVAAIVLTRVLRGLLFGVAATEPASYAAAVFLLAAVAALAGWLPARRAARVDPVEALRQE